jgi:hypothetical protein
VGALMTQYYVCHYVNREDPGDLLWGYNWREAVLVVEGKYPHFPRAGEHAAIEACMFDLETGKNVGDTRNFCVSQYCSHEDCGPSTLQWEISHEEETLQTEV